MLAALLLALTSWDRVLLDCGGGNEVMGHYYFRATMRQVADIPCLDDQGQAALCPTTIPDMPRAFGPSIPDPGSGVTVSTDFDPVEDPDLLPVPPVGGLAAWPWFSPENMDPVVAVDAAGNESTQCQ